MKSNQNRNRKTNPPPVKSKNQRKKIIAGLIIFLIISGIITYAVLVHGNSNNANPNIPLTTPVSSTSPSPSTSPASSTFNPANVVPLTSPAGEYSASGTKVLFITSMGDIVIQLRDDKPITTANFVNLVKEGLYNGTIFQRVIAGFMIQGGEINANIPTITDEIGNDNINSNMTIAMANTGQPNSASSQFFINVANNNNLYPSFDTSYTVFGQVIYGQNTVMKISETPVEYSAAYNENSQPVHTVTLIGASILS